jgi:hypothetical protein
VITLLWRYSALAALVLLVMAGTGPSAPARAGSPQGTVAQAETDQENLTANPAASSGSCGVFRWSVKTGTDAAAASVSQSSTTPTTIAAQDAIPQPGSLPSASRLAPVETTVYSIDATLTLYKLETDSDYHLVASDGSGHTMIAEIPDPACVGSGSPFAASVRSARSMFDARFTATSTFQTAGVPVHIRGAGFWDEIHGQTGVAPNGIELHPILGISLGG